MSHQVLARKWRPRIFREMVGQEHVLKALINALDQGQIAGAGLDVLEQEPPEPDNPLFSMENVIITPHVASATTRMRPETRRRVGREVALVLRGKWPMSCVNPTVLPRVTLERWQPYPMNRGPNR